MFVDTVRRIAPCGTFRPTFAGLTPGPSFNSNSGYGVSTSSTTPGPLYATALFPVILVPLVMRRRPLWGARDYSLNLSGRTFKTPRCDGPALRSDDRERR